MRRRSAAGPRQRERAFGEAGAAGRLPRRRLGALDLYQAGARARRPRGGSRRRRGSRRRPAGRDEPRVVYARLVGAAARWFQPGSRAATPTRATPSRATASRRPRDTLRGQENRGGPDDRARPSARFDGRDRWGCAHQPLDRRKTVAGRSGRSGPVYNPATGAQTGEVDFASAEEVDAAVAAAKEALPAWRAPSLAQAHRAPVRVPRARARPARGRSRGSSRASTARCSPTRSARSTRGLEVIEFGCGIPKLLKGGFSEHVSTGVDVYSIRQPLGVVAGITPFNFPAMVPMWMLAPALACGNTFVLKPSEKDPSRVALRRRAAAGGRPARRRVQRRPRRQGRGRRLLEHPDVAAVSFVGSTPIARYIYETGTQQRQARAGARRRQEPHGRAARRRHRHGRRRRGQRGLRLGGRALHGHLGRRRRRRRRRPARRGDQGAPAEDQGRRRHRARRRRWAR